MSNNRTSLSRKFLILLNLSLVFLYPVRAFQKDPSLLKLCWKYEGEVSSETNYASDNSSKIPSLHQSNIFYFDTNGNLSALSIENGKTEWKTEVGGESTSDIVFDNESVYLVSKAPVNTGNLNNNKLTIRALGIKTGVVRWQTIIQSEENSQNGGNTKNFSEGSLFLHLNNLYFFTKSGILHTFNKTDGMEEVKSIDLGINPSSNILIKQGKLYFGSSEKEIILYDLSDKTLDKVAVEILPESLRVSTEHIAVADRIGNIITINKIGKRLFRFRAGAEATDLSLSDKYLFIASSDNYIYAFNLKGKRLWKKRFAGRNKVYFSETYKTLFAGEQSINTAVALNYEKGRTMNTFIFPDQNSFTLSVTQLGNKIIFWLNTGIYTYTDSNCSLKGGDNQQMKKSVN